MESKFLKFLPKKNQWLVVLLIGLLLVVIALPTGSASDGESGAESGSKANSGITYESTAYEDATEEEQHLEHILSNMQNVGEVHVMITYQEDEQVRGIVVVAEGAGSETVVRNITVVVQALFDVDSHKIKVIESK